MQNLTDLEAIKKIDVHNSLETTDLLLDQCEAALQQVQALTLPNLQGQVKNIIFCGMGASIYGALVTKALMGDKFPYPMEFVSDYHIPSYVNNETLVILTSYSGTTEEVLSCAQEAKEKGAKMLVLTKGGPLATFAQDNNVPSYIFDGKLNLSSTPRLGNGYSVIGLMGMFAKMGLLPIDVTTLEAAIAATKTKHEMIKQKAMQDSELFVDTIPVVFAAEHLTGNGQILRNQFNETSKNFSALYIVPDLNHHLMEGLQFPKESKLYFIFLNATNYSPKIQKRMLLTKDVVLKNGHKIYEYNASGANVYEDFMEVMIWGGYLTLYLGLRYDQDPAINPWVDYFKAELAK